MAALVIFASFSACAVLFLYHREPLPHAFLKSALVTSLELWGITELLSIFDGITYGSVLGSWCVLLLLKVSLLISYWLKHREDIRTRFRGKGISFTGSRYQAILIVLLGLLLAGTFFVALKAPPNTFDSMTYHMPRVSHWIQNRSVKFYPTPISRQNYSMPFAEYAILHLQILSKTDRLANLVQWSGFVLSGLVTALIARELGLNSFGQLLTGLLAATLPMALLQSVTTQNDLVVGLFCLSFLYFLLRARKDLQIKEMVFAGIGLGLALLSKGTGYIFCAAIGLVQGIFLLIEQKKHRMKALALLVLVVGIGVAINSGHLLRMYETYQDPLLKANQRTLVDKVTVQNTAVNLVRNGAIHLATPFDSVNERIGAVVDQALGSGNDNPEALFQGAVFKLSFSIDEDLAGNFLHFLMISIALVAGAGRWRKNKNQATLYLTVILSILLFSMSLKWQPWTSRLQTTVFLLGSILVAEIMVAILGSERWITVGAILIFAASLPYLLLTITRPILPAFPKDAAIKNNRPVKFVANKIDKFLIHNPGFDEMIRPIKLNFLNEESIILTERVDQYFFAYSSLADDYQEAVSLARSYDVDQVGLVLGPNSWEYPVWVLFDRHARPGSPGICILEQEEGKGGWVCTDAGDKPALILEISDTSRQGLDPAGLDLLYQSPSISLYEDPTAALEPANP